MNSHGHSACRRVVHKVLGRWTLWTATAVLVAGPSADAGTISLSSFYGLPSGVKLYGSAYSAGDHITLTPADRNQMGGLSFDYQHFSTRSVQRWDVTFDIRGHSNSYDGGADGWSVSFTPGSLGAVGESGASSGVAVGFKTFHKNDINYFYNGSQRANWYVPSPDFNDGSWHTIRVIKDFDGYLYTYVDGNLRAYQSGYTAQFAGRFLFGARTGNSYTHQDIDNIKITTFAPLLSAGVSNAGYTLVGESRSGYIQVRNVGDNPSTLSGYVTGFGGPFSLTTSSSFSLGYNSAANKYFSFAPSSRGTFSRGIGVNSNGTNKTVTISGTGVAPVNQVNVLSNAGPVRIGTTGTATVQVRNIGNGNLSGRGTVSNLRGATQAVSGAFSGSAKSINLTDGASQTVSYNFTPTTRGAVSEQVGIDFYNGDAGGGNKASTVYRTITGTGVGPEFASSVPVGSTIDFGKVLAGTFANLPLDISNVTTDSGDDSLTGLTLLGYSIDGPDASYFSLDGFTPGMVLSKGALASFGLKFNSQGPDGLKQATLTLLTDQGAAFGQAGQSFQFSVQGTVVPEPSSFILLGMGGLALVLGLRRRKGRSICKDSAA